MAHFKALFLLSLLFAAVLVISSRASAEGGTQVDDWHGGGGGYHGGGGGYHGGGGGYHGGGGGHHGGGGGYHGGGGGHKP